MDLDFINVISTKRSGHHAFIAWMRRHRGAPSSFFNNVVIGKPMDARLRAIASGSPRQDGSSRPGTIIFNYEGVTPLGLETAWRAQRAVSGRRSNLLFLRDPLNLCASLLHHKRFVRLNLVMILRQLFALRDWLKAFSEAAVPGLRLVAYSPWLADAGYRQRVADGLDLRSSDRLTALTRHGGGSSFKDLASVEDDDAERLTTRWHAYRNSSLHGGLITHPRLWPWFEAALAGDIKDSFGGDLSDPAGLAHLRALDRSRRLHPFVDGALAALSERQDIFHRIECGTPLQQRSQILRAGFVALAGRG